MGLANSPWPKYGGKDLRNTCIQTIGGTPLSFPQVKWMTYKGSGYGSLSTPVIDTQGNIYVGDYDGYLTCIDKDGNIKWRYFVNSDGIDSSAAIGDDGTVYIGSYGRNPGQLLALNPDGSLKWVYEVTQESLYSSPTIAPDGTIYVGGNSYLYAINPDGTLKWRQDGWGTFQHPPAIDAERDVIYCFGVFAYQLDGQLKWYYRTPLTINGPIVDGNGHIYTAGHNGVVYALYPDGTLKWGGQKTSDRNLGLALGIDGSVLVGCDDGGLYAFDPDTGDLKWRHQRGDWVFNPCVSASGIIYCTDRDSYIFALNHEGVLLWEFNPYDYDMGGVASDIILDDKGVLYYQDWSGYVVALRVESVFEVVSTNPPQDANNVDPNTNIQITFSDSLDTTTISYDTLQVYGWLPEQYEHQWTYDDGTKTLTLTIPGGLETDASIIVNLTDGLKSTGGVSLTPYALGFSTSKLPLQQCDPPTIIEPATARCARPMIILQAPTPARPRAKWRLHFRVRSYADEGGTQLIGAVDSSTNPELFEYSPDNGLTWSDFPVTGLPREQYGALVRVRVEVGPRTQVWLKTSVGAEDA